MTRSSVLLPLPDGPSRATTSPSATVQRDAVEHGLVAVAGAEVSDLEHGRS